MDDDYLLVCGACNGKGRSIDRWGSMWCWTCQGTGKVLKSKWYANVFTYPCFMQDYLLAHMPPRYTGEPLCLSR